METERILGEYATYENNKESKKHESSGRISPSKLAYPTQTSVLQLLNVQADPFDDKVLRIFERGKSVERYLVRAYKRYAPYGSMQSPRQYRNAIGYEDIFVQETIECKSVNQNKFLKIKKERKPQTSHAIQCAYYLLAQGTTRGRISYVCADNLQAIDFPIYARYWSAQVNYRIDAIYQSILDRSLPDFLPLEAWHKSKFYTPFKEFYGLKGDKAEALLKEKYPESYNKLKSGELIPLCDKPYTNLIRLQGASNVSLLTTQSPEIQISNCGANCVSCSIRHLIDRSTITETSLVYFVPCLRSTMWRERAEK
jgi:hypothetical protein